MINVGGRTVRAAHFRTVRSLLDMRDIIECHSSSRLSRVACGGLDNHAILDTGLEPVP